mgnify:CR=1 FL=1
MAGNHKHMFGKVFPINSLPGSSLVSTGMDRIHNDAAIKYDATRKYYEKVDADILFCFSDIAIQAEAMGARVNIPRDAMPSILETAKSIHEPNPSKCERMRVNSEVVRALKSCFREKSISAVIYGPFTVAGQLIGEQAALKKVVNNPEEVSGVLSRTFRVALAYADYMLNSGADVLWVSDPLAALLPPDCFEEFAGKYLARLFSSFSSVPSVIHICGDTSELLPQIVQTGPDAISFDQCMDLLLVEDGVPDEVFIMGNIDPSEVMEQSDLETVEEEVSDQAHIMGAVQNYIMSTGCALPPSTPIENVQAFISAARKVLGAIEDEAAPLNEIRSAVFEGDEERANTLTKNICDQVNIPVNILIKAGLMRSVRKGSVWYEAKRKFLPDILLMAEAFYAGYSNLRLHTLDTEHEGTEVVVGAVKGDYHEIGKDLVKIFLEINGFRVLDLGVDVLPEDFISAAVSNRGSVIGVSIFVTSCRSQLKKIIEEIHRQGLKDIAIVAGGAAVNRSIVFDQGADGYARDAVEAVSVINRLYKRL